MSKLHRTTSGKDFRVAIINVFLPCSYDAGRRQIGQIRTQAFFDDGSISWIFSPGKKKNKSYILLIDAQFCPEKFNPQVFWHSPAWTFNPCASMNSLGSHTLFVLNSKIVICQQKSFVLLSYLLLTYNILLL